MRVQNVSAKINFKRNLTQDELKEYSSVLKQGKELVGQTDKSIFIMPTSCLPQTEEFNSGIGHLSSDISQNYLEYMKNYLGINVVEDLPAGQVKSHGGFYCAYKASALALGNQQINPELLTGEDYAHILSKEDLAEIASGNKNANKDTISNFRNVMDNDGNQNKALHKAFENFQKLDDNSPLKQRFAKYTIENANWLNFRRENEPSQEFFKFKQFLADEHLKIAKDKLNSKGIKLCGDCLIGFSKDEIRAFPNAFLENGCIGDHSWNIKALNYDTILDETSDSSKLLKQKVQLFAKRYDMIRFDVGWAYVTPYITENGNSRKISFGDKLLEKIEEWVKEVKGEDFDIKKNLIYEFGADIGKFQAFSENKLIEPLKGRVKIYESTYMHNNGDGWGYNKAFLDRGWSPDEYILGVGNHDSQPLRQIALNIAEEGQKSSNYKKNAIGPLSEVLKISSSKLNDPTTFAKAKWAEPMMSKNNMMFYMDVFGREERFNMHEFNITQHPELNFAYKVPTDYQKAYQKGIQEGFGFNPMDSLEKVFKAKGLDKSNPDLFKKITKYNKILQDPNENTGESTIKHKAILIALGTLVASVASIFTFSFVKKHKNNADNKHDHK